MPGEWNYTDEELRQALGLPPKQPERTIGGTLKDIGVTAGKAVIGTGEALAGLANLATLGGTGKLLNAAGYDPNAARRWLSQFNSEAQQAADKKVEDATGFTGTLKAMWDNPSTIATTVGESLPSMFLGAGIGGKGVQLATKYLPKLAPKAAAKYLTKEGALNTAGRAALGGTFGAAGEGAVTAGALAEQMRQENPDKELTGKQALYSGLGGALTGGLGRLGGALARRANIADIDSLIAARAGMTPGRIAGGEARGLTAGQIAKGIGGGALIEGVAEELPQSMQEQIWTNLGTGKPWNEDVGKAGAQGMVAGAVMGGGANVRASLPGMQREIRERLEAEERARLNEEYQNLRAGLERGGNTAATATPGEQPMNVGIGDSDGDAHAFTPGGFGGFGFSGSAFQDAVRARREQEFREEEERRSVGVIGKALDVGGFGATENRAPTEMESLLAQQQGDVDLTRAQRAAEYLGERRERNQEPELPPWHPLSARNQALRQAAEAQRTQRRMDAMAAAEQEREQQWQAAQEQELQDQRGAVTRSLAGIVQQRLDNAIPLGMPRVDAADSMLAAGQNTARGEAAEQRLAHEERQADLEHAFNNPDQLELERLLKAPERRELMNVLAGRLGFRNAEEQARQLQAARDEAADALDKAAYERKVQREIAEGKRLKRNQRGDFLYVEPDGPIPDELRQRLAPYANQLAEGQRGEKHFTENEAGDDVHITGQKSSYPAWFRKKSPYAKEYDQRFPTLRSSTADQILRVLEKVRDGQGADLGKNQRSIWYELQDLAFNGYQEEPGHPAATIGQYNEAGEQEAIEEGYAQEHGITYTGDQPLPAAVLAPGDRVQMRNRAGEPDIATHVGYTKDGKVILKDGVERHLEPTDVIETQGIDMGRAGHENPVSAHLGDLGGGYGFHPPAERARIVQERVERGRRRAQARQNQAQAAQRQQEWRELAKAAVGTTEYQGATPQENVVGNAREFLNEQRRQRWGERLQDFGGRNPLGGALALPGVRTADDVVRNARAFLEEQGRPARRDLARTAYGTSYGTDASGAADNALAEGGRQQRRELARSATGTGYATDANRAAEQAVANRRADRAARQAYGTAYSGTDGDVVANAREFLEGQRREARRELARTAYGTSYASAPERNAPTETAEARRQAERDKVLAPFAEATGIPLEQLQAEYEAVRKRHAKELAKGRKAPNGKDSNLTKEQWILARTPSFLRRYGNWAYDEDAQVSAVDLNDLSEIAHFTKVEQLREWAKKKYKDELVTVASDGAVVGFTVKGIRDSFKSTRKDKGKNADLNRAKKAVYAKLNDLIKSSVFFGFEETDDADKHEGVIGQDIYIAAMEIDKKTYAVRFKFNIYRDAARIFKDRKVAEIDISLAVNVGTDPNGPAATTSKGYSFKIGDLLTAVKQDAAKVQPVSIPLTPNGEPDPSVFTDAGKAGKPEASAAPEALTPGPSPRGRGETGQAAVREDNGTPEQNAVRPLGRDEIGEAPNGATAENADPLAASKWKEPKKYAYDPDRYAPVSLNGGGADGYTNGRIAFLDFRPEYADGQERVKDSSTGKDHVANITLGEPGPDGIVRGRLEEGGAEISFDTELTYMGDTRITALFERAGDDKRAAEMSYAHLNAVMYYAQKRRGKDADVRFFEGNNRNRSILVTVNGKPFAIVAPSPSTMSLAEARLAVQARAASKAMKEAKPAPEAEAVPEKERAELKAKAEDDGARYSKTTQSVAPENRADIEAELREALGRGKADKLLGDKGGVRIVETQEEARQLIGEDNETVKRAGDGAIQGFHLDGIAYLVRDGIAKGKAMGVLMHEYGEHAAQLGFHNNVGYRAILKSLENRRNERSATGDAIRAAMERAKNAGLEENDRHFWSEVAAYIVEANANVKTSALDRVTNFFKKWLFKVSGLGADNFTHKDLVMFAKAAVKAGNRLPANLKAHNDAIYALSWALSFPVKHVEAEYKAVRKRYKGTEQWMKTPDGKESKLTEEQWVLSRMPSFRRAYGNWAHNPDTPVNVVDLNHVSLTTTGVDFTSKKETHKLISGLYAGSKVVVSSDGTIVGFSKGKLNDSIKRHSDAGNKVYIELNNLIRNSVYFDFEISDGKPKHAGVIGQDVYYSAMTIGNKGYSVKFKFDVGKRDASSTYKAHNVAEVTISELQTKAQQGTKKSSAVSHVGTARARAHARTEDLVRTTLAEVTAQVKPPVVKIPLANGEPAASVFADMARDGARLSFAGEQGAAALDAAEEATTRLDNLKIARDMEAAGKDAKTVKLATGWERGADGKWRYEIDDSGSTLNLDAMQNGPAKLADVLDAPELFKAYPQLENVKVWFEDLPEDTLGSYSKSGNRIALNESLQFKQNKIRSVLLHEVQHAIQEIEGFAKGGNAEQLTDYGRQRLSNEAFDKLQAIEREHRDAVRDFIVRNGRRYIDEWTDADVDENGAFSEPYNIGGKNVSSLQALASAVTDRMIDNGATPEKALADIIRDADGAMHEFFESEGIYDDAPKAFAEIARRHKNQKAALDAIGTQDPLTTYKRLGGETESRNVQRRLNMTAEERRASLASETEDVAREDQIVLERMLGNAASAEAAASPEALTPGPSPRGRGGTRQTAATEADEPRRANGRPARREGESVPDYNRRVADWRKRLRAEVKAATDLVRKLIPGLTVRNTTDLDGDITKLKGEVRHLRNTKGVIVGAYHAGSKTVLLTPDADASTVLHEVGWHAVYDWAKHNAPDLYRQMRSYARNAPESVKDWVRELYGNFTAEGILDEIGARMFTEQGRADFEKAVKDRAARTWYRKLAELFREMWNRFTGAHRADLGAYRGMEPEEAMRRLLADITAGRRLQGGARSEERGVGGTRLQVAPDTSDSLPKAPDGSIRMGEIDAERGAKMRRQPGEIRLYQGEHDPKTDKGYGIVHIEARHGREIRQAGYNSAEHFVADVAANYNEARRGGGGAILLIKKNGADKVAVIRLAPHESGDFYNVESAYLSRSTGKKELLWNAAQSRSEAPGGQPAFARASVAESDQTTPNALPTSNGKSVQESGRAVNDEDDGTRYSFAGEQGAATRSDEPDEPRRANGRPARREGEALKDYNARYQKWREGRKEKLWNQVKEQIGNILPDKAQANAIIGIIEARAKSAGISAAEFVHRRGLEFKRGKTPGAILAQGEKLQGAFNPRIYRDEGRAVISAFEAADVSTLAHELAHMFRQDLERFGQTELLKAAEKWAGVKDGKWTREQEEMFARAFERYLRQGKAPTKEMKGVFARFRDWLTNIYRTLKGSPLDVRLTPEITRVFDALLTENAALDRGDALGDTGAATRAKNAQAELNQASGENVPGNAETFDSRGEKPHPAAMSMNGTKQQMIAAVAKRMGIPPEQLQAEYDAVFKRHKDTPQWRKAPNGKDSNLTPEQWVLARTPSFKRHVGDWETVAIAQAIRSLDPVDATNIPEMPDKKAIEEYFRNNPTATNRRNGVTASFPVATAGKIYGHRGIPVGRIAGRLKEIFEQSILGSTESEILKPGHKAHNNIESYNHYVGKVSLGEGADGGEFYVRFTVRKEFAGRKGNAPRQEMHSVAISEVHIYEKPNAASLTGYTPGAGSQTALVDSKLRDFFVAVNREKVGGELDANGEPTVDAFGTTGDGGGTNGGQTTENAALDRGDALGSGAAERVPGNAESFDSRGEKQQRTTTPNNVQQSTTMSDKTTPLKPPLRTAWTDETADAVIMAPHGAAQKSEWYEAAKNGGDPKAAYEVVLPLVTQDGIASIREKLRGKKDAVVVPVVSEERLGKNMIPRAYAEVLADALGISTATDIVHINKVNRGGSDGFHRLAAHPTFAGPVEAGKEYIIVDDTITQGGTLAALKGYIETNGGKVVVVAALTGKQYSARLKPDQATIEAIRAKYPTLEEFWHEHFGYGFEYLTNSEANYLRAVKRQTVDSIRDRILEESGQGGEQDNQGPDSQRQGNGPVLRGDKPIDDGSDGTPSNPAPGGANGSSAPPASSQAGAKERDANATDEDPDTLYQTQSNPAANNTVTGQSFVDRILSRAKPEYRDMWERFIYNFIDNNDPRERVWKSAGSPTDNDFVTVERLRGKKTAAEQKKFREEMVTPLLKTLGQGRLAVSDLEEYAWALHTPERNQRMREVNAKRTLDELAKHMSDADRQNLKAQMAFISTQGKANGWTQSDIQQSYLALMDDVFRDIAHREAALSNLPRRQRDAERRRIEATKQVRDRWNDESVRFAGQTDQEAQAVIDKWRRDNRFAALQRARQQMADISAATLDVLHEAGELDDEEYQGMKNGYRYYVPLHRDGFLDTTPIRLLQVAKGSKRAVVNILPNVVRSHDTAIARKHKIEAGRALYEFAQAHPDAGISIEELEKKPTHDREGNIVMYTSQAEPEDGIFIRYGGRKHLLRFAADTRTAEGRTLGRFLDSVKGSDANLNGLTQMLHGVTRWLSAVNTTLNPEFVITNFSRDLQTAFIHLHQTGIDRDGLKKAVARDIFPAMKGIFAAERGDRNTAMGRWYSDYEANGGKVGWAQNYEQAAEVAKEIERELKLHKDGHHAYKAYRRMKDVVNHANAAIENCMRLATYKNLVERGVSKQQAARIASSLTVDFTQHGKMNPQINALYMFFNASVQGTVRMVQAMASSRKVQALAGGIAGAGFLLQMLALAGGGDDDSGEPNVLGIPDAIRERNIIIMLPGSDGKKYIKIPKAYGYGALYDFGAELANSIYMGAQGRKYDHAKGAMRVVNSFANSFNPIQSATLLQQLSPTLLDPLVYVSENKSWMGLPLMPEQNPYGPSKPDSERYWKGTSPIFKQLSKWLNQNKLVGGDAYSPGRFAALTDISPETFSMLWDTGTGGMGRFFGNVVSLPFTVAAGDTEAHKIPVARQVYGEWNDRAISTRYYEAMDRAEIAHMRFKNAESPPERKRLYQTPDHQLYLRSREAEKRIRALRKRQQQLEAAGNKNGAERIRTRIVAAQARVLAAMP